MRTYHCFLLMGWYLCLMSGFAPIVPEARAEEAAFLQAELIPPVWSTDPLQIRFLPDEKQCRKAYGEQWESRCFTALGQSGVPGNGVTLKADRAGGVIPNGAWRWVEYNVLSFIPESSWSPDTAFTVDVSRIPLPSRVKVGNRALKGTTLPFAGQSAKGEVWIDPSVSGARAVSFALRFTAPPGRDFEKNMVVKVKDISTGIGKMQVIWGQDEVSCLVRIPVTSLPDTDTILSLHVAGTRPVHLEDGRVQIGRGDLIQTVTLPGKKHLFRISEASLQLEETKTLTREYHLTLKTSLRVPAAELLKALKVVELPDMQNPEATVPYRWTSAPVIEAADLEKARALAVELIRDPGDSGEPLVVRVPATPGRYVYCTLPAGFGPGGGGSAEYVLTAPWTAVFQAQKPESVVSFLQPGHVLPLTPEGDNRLDIFSSGVDTVRWRATRIRADSLNLMQICTFSFDRLSATSQMDMASTVVEGVIPLPAVREGELASRFSTLSLDELMRGGTGLMNVELSGVRDGVEVASTSRLVLATDLGMVSKMLPDGGRQVFVCSLRSGQPVRDALVRILGANGQPVAEAHTDTSGYVALPSVNGLIREKQPVALVASHIAEGRKRGEEGSEDLAWMALDDMTRRVDFSRFPTQGQISSPDNINAYVFGQRGIFRPGETLCFGMVIRRGDWKSLPPDMPLVATLTDPAGRIALRRPFTVGEGLIELSWTSSETSPAGRYRLDVSTPASSDILGSGVVRVEEFQPDTLAIRAEVLREGKTGEPVQGEKVEPRVSGVSEGWLVTPRGDSGVTLAVSLRNFYGLPAEGRKIRAELSVHPASLRFSGFEDFTFPDMLPSGNEAETASAILLPESVTTAEGQARVPLPLSVYQNRTRVCRVLVEGFEPDGGRAVSTEARFLVSPLPVMLGYRPSGAAGDTRYVPQGTRGGLEFVVLGPDLRPANPGDLRLSVAERRYVTVLSTDAQGGYVYEESPVDQERSATTVKVDPATGRLDWVMPTDTPGEFLLTVRHGEDTLLARIPFTVAGNDDVRPARNESAASLPSTQLRLRLDKTDYAPGDTVNIFMSAPYDGVGLITLERDRVAAHVWFKASAGHSVHSLTLPEDFEGRGYINVTMGRAVTSPEIFMQPHSFAVTPLTVNVAGRDMGLKIEAPQQILPGTMLKARLTARHTGKALLFAVDEGVLQLTRFSTPDPLRYLLLDRALEVNTDQLFDLLMPVHAQLGKRLPAFGGDMDLSGGRFQNPFRRRSEPPLAWWSGVVETGPQGTEVNIPVPAYANGQVRLMAVAVSPETAGSTEARTIVLAPLVITPQLPLMVAPGDVFEGGISLHNTTDKPLSVTLQGEKIALTLQKNAKGETGLPEKVDIAAGKEVFLPMRCAASDMPGEASFTVLALTGEGQAFRRAATLSVRPATLPRQELRTGFASVMEGSTLPAEALTRKLYPFMADASASVSAAPLPPLRALLRGLAAYPYTCVEQSISRAFPLVLLQRRPGMTALLTPPLIGGKPRAEVHARMLEQALTAIRAGFKQGEGVAAWADAENTEMLLTAYAGDYLLSLREAGLTLPGDLSTSFLDTLQRCVDVTPDSLNAARAQAYGLWVLTRSGVITSQGLDTLREQLNEQWQGWEKDVTASLMAGSYALMNMHVSAQQLLNAGGEGELMESRGATAMTVLAARSLHVAVLARHFPERLANRAGTLASRLLEGVNSSTLSTFESALGARALLELAAPVSGGAAIASGAQVREDPFVGAELLCTAYQPGFEPVDKDNPLQTTPDRGMLPHLLTLSAPGCTQFSLKGNTGKTPLYWEVSSDGYDRQPPDKASSNGMEVTRVFKLPDGSTLGADSLVRQGMVLRVELTARVFGNTGNVSEPNAQVVLADIFPGGFELVLSHPDDVVPRSENVNAYNRLDRREDRVVAHATVREHPVTFVYHLRAVNRGTYTLPAAYGEGLYDRSLNSHTAAGMITVQ